MTGISIIIPNYNRAELIGFTLQNMLHQTVLPDEIIVIDDGSTDNSVEIIKSFGNRVKLLKQKNQGPGAARNLGLSVAKGEFIQFMDSDDLMSLNKLELQLGALKTSGADFAYCSWVRTLIQDQQLSLQSPILQGKALPDSKSMLEWQLGSWSIIFQNCLFRRKALDNAGRYLTDMRVAEDGEYLVRILYSGAQPVFTNQCLVFYRTGGNDQISASASSNQRQANDLTKYYERVGNILSDNLSKMKESTKRDLVLELYRHNRYCKTNGYGTTDLNNPLQKLVSGYPIIFIKFLVYSNALKKKLSSAPACVPRSKAMQPRAINDYDLKLAKELEALLEKINKL